MEVIAPVPYNECAGSCDKGLVEGGQSLKYAVNKLVDDVWAALIGVSTGGFTRHCETLRKADELISHPPTLPLYTNPPPSYDDAISDLPPDYSTLPPLAERRTTVAEVAPVAPATKSRDQSSSLLKDRSRDVYIDFESAVGIREHKKKKGPTATKKAAASTPPADNGGGSDNAGDDQANGDGAGGDAGGGDGGGGDGDGGGGDGGDDWNDWAVSGSKKKSKKKEEEEEEEERKAAEASAAKNLSWADDVEDGGDDSWAGFATVGKKKKGKVWFKPEAPWLGRLLMCNYSPTPRLADFRM